MLDVFDDRAGAEEAPFLGLDENTEKGPVVRAGRCRAGIRGRNVGAGERWRGRNVGAGERRPGRSVRRLPRLS